MDLTYDNLLAFYQANHTLVQKTKNYINRNKTNNLNNYYKKYAITDDMSDEEKQARIEKRNAYNARRRELYRMERERKKAELFSTDSDSSNASS
tara:strand:+ start:4292 stop:4573 length:282 start_codon:yes stop_codon:yes gene_type:complete